MSRSSRGGRTPEFVARAASLTPSPRGAPTHSTTLRDTGARRMSMRSPQTTPAAAPSALGFHDIISVISENKAIILAVLLGVSVLAAVVVIYRVRKEYEDEKEKLKAAHKAELEKAAQTAVCQAPQPQIIAQPQPQVQQPQAVLPPQPQVQQQPTESAAESVTDSEDDSWLANSGEWPQPEANITGNTVSVPPATTTTEPTAEQ